MKLLTIFIIGIIVLGIGVYYMNTHSYYNFGKIKIEKNVLNDMTKDYENGFVLCDIDDSKCFFVGKLNKVDG